MLLSQLQSCTGAGAGCCCWRGSWPEDPRGCAAAARATAAASGGRAGHAGCACCAGGCRLSGNCRYHCRAAGGGGPCCCGCGCCWGGCCSQGGCHGPGGGGGC